MKVAYNKKKKLDALAKNDNVYYEILCYKNVWEKKRIES